MLSKIVPSFYILLNRVQILLKLTINILFIIILIILIGFDKLLCYIFILN